MPSVLCSIFPTKFFHISFHHCSLALTHFFHAFGGRSTLAFAAVASPIFFPLFKSVQCLVFMWIWLFFCIPIRFFFFLLLHCDSFVLSIFMSYPYAFVVWLSFRNMSYIFYFNIFFSQQFGLWHYDFSHVLCTSDSSLQICIFEKLERCFFFVSHATEAKVMNTADSYIFRVWWMCALFFYIVNGNWKKNAFIFDAYAK